MRGVCRRGARSGRAAGDGDAGDRGILDREGGVMAERMKPQKERDLPVSEEEWRKRLRPEQFEVLRNKGTEPELRVLQEAGELSCSSASTPRAS